MWGLLLLLSVALLVVGIWGLIRPIPRIGVTSRRVAALVLLGSIGSCVAAGALMPPLSEEAQAELAQADAARQAAAEEERQAKKRADAQRRAAREQARRPSIAKADDAITSVERTGTSLTVWAHIEIAWDAPGYIDAAGVLLEDLAKTIQARPVELDEETTRIGFYVTVAGTDRLGNDTSVGLFNLTFAASDLQQANLKNLSGPRLLNLAEMVNVTSPAGRQAVNAWCAKEYQASQAADFCVRARAR